MGDRKRRGGSKWRQREAKSVGPENGYVGGIQQNSKKGRRAQVGGSGRANDGGLPGFICLGLTVSGGAGRRAISKDIRRGGEGKWVFKAN